MNNSPQMQMVRGCSFISEVDNIVTYYDLNGLKKGEHKLEYLAVGGDCTIENALFPAISDNFYVQDERETIDLVDISNDNWEVVKQNQFTNLYRPLNIYQNKIILNPNIEDLINKSNFKILLLDLNTKEETSININLNLEISKIFANATVIQDTILVTSNNNWISFFAQIQPSNCSESCEENIRYWLYRYNINNGENSTFHGTILSFYEYGFRELDQFQISQDGRFAFVVEDYPYNKILSLELEANKIKEISKGISVRNKWILGDSIYYIVSDNSEYSVGYHNFTSGETQTIIEFDNIFPNKIVITDNYIIIIDTRVANSNFPVGNSVLTVIGSILFLIVIRRKNNKHKHN